MSKKKGLSVEEKRTKMMEFFYEKKDFFQLKELEKQCQKEKGITSMSVKEVLTSLVDDGMVDTDKIGTSVYFWAFPSKASQNRIGKLEELNQKLNESEAKKKQLEILLAQSKLGKEKNDKRIQILEALSQKQSEKESLVRQLESYSDCDPEVMQLMKQDSIVAKEAVNRWTDNIFTMKSWMKNKFSCEEAIINKQFEIPENLDYIE